MSVNGEDRPRLLGEKGVLRVSAVSNGYFQPCEHKAIVESELEFARTSPKADRIIISRSNTEALVGASAYVEFDYPDLFLSDKLWQVEPDHKMQTSMRWLGYWLSSETVRVHLSKLGTGTSGSMKNISKEELLSLRIALPSFGEQTRIAGLLEAWDDAITTTEKLLGNGHRQKQALMQQLLTGKRRPRKFVGSRKRVATRFGSLPADWKHVAIERVANEISAKNRSDDKLPVLSCTKHAGLVDSLAYFNKRVFSENTTTYKLVERGCFAYATNHIDEGSIGYQNLYDKALISPMYTVFKTTAEIDDGFLFKLLKTDHYRQIFAANTNASVDRRGSLRWSDFKKIEIPLPSLEEQLAISAVIDAADREISNLERQIAGLREEKRALMQQLLTGKRRVRVPETVAEASPS